jgi:hypothetical protein
MGSNFDYVPVQLTKAFREAQADEQFQSWLKMQEAVMGIEFPINDLPEIRDSMFTKESLVIVEAKLLDLYPDDAAAYATEDDVHRTMRYVYYLGETFRRAFDGTWVAVPQQNSKNDAGVLTPAIDVPFRETFIQPTLLVRFALNRRSGDEITPVYGHTERAYHKWEEAGRPERTFRGTLREGGD